MNYLTSDVWAYQEISIFSSVLETDQCLTSRMPKESVSKVGLPYPCLDRRRSRYDF